MTFPSTKRFTIDEYHHLIKLRFFHADDDIELIHAEIIEMANKTVTLPFFPDLSLYSLVFFLIFIK
ncbi:MAG: hypothetical protein KME49_06235 [Brasilonema octagenarum HA4186-MV1]|jgi:Uma2 family endonuclease|uniref:Uncharacterized protein n=2 Tax=Brasilonema TaxID=383614 RepID=A0A856MJU2_9CYAN|nr:MULTISPECIES: hypothetical protein [Brasilonema]MBW4625101.1 hypothetical protein [Brasilonema octagenarum HA4186-MV1]NMF63096.1 hypothetical protein [Brasilonema octagenarum UFV-OR1]QDL10430.1 hypothetical protein DP114_23295 [Brasilonema sennae CENA114]QDL16776.1 hypothetical protein DP113_23200 [Brasilonema octagenarum UFV-E1]